MSVALDVGIGLVLLYLLLALMVTTLQELLATAFSQRAKHLFGAIAGMLNTANAGGKSVVQQFYEHPLIRNLVNEELELVGDKPTLTGKGLPSYIPSKTFALALVDVLRKDKTTTAALGADQVLAGAGDLVKDLPEGQLKNSLSLLLADVGRFGDDIDKRSAVVSDRIEQWFNDRMARASGWYKRKAQVVSLLMALGLTAAFNADTLRVAQELWNDAPLRASVVGAATQVNDAHGVPATVSMSALPVGWHLDFWNSLQGFDYLWLLAGWVITTLAVSLGAGFWFDVLSKALQIRGSGLKVSAATGEVVNGAK